MLPHRTSLGALGMSCNFGEVFFDELMGFLG
ncbi:Uncharacterised protein [Mycobacteroides abscessus subsp. abscessus]|uniref:Uncharacterized protein n=1 Tax=Mycobacteroides abscessus subsp. massiliense TaxID=1962118 RepID=A0A1U5Y3T1_9MYCO|nr:Uncharacterised protein [Mycobacteroides abscessus]SIG93364.1 Uncharacterised protein [Mycobacteroides abscessus subsp. abscessus]SKM48250.1 Uncharacterised protein [Mycobacteroides abscessus subsp. massiliense]CPZ81095.1 Uncharacterised protein [Mycobacteroides abscessus]SIH01294.1 Uncharacterised protein [Mycobacteroides abscessus subsp. abscessus]